MLPIFSHVEPVLAVKDIPETLRYWQEVLGFPNKWVWGDPPTIAAVSWQKAHIQFYQDAELAAASQGNSIWIRLQHIEALYSLHQQKNAEIVSPLENKPWGTSQYTIRDINGYYICFAGVIEERTKSEPEMPATIRITGRKPTLKEIQDLNPEKETRVLDEAREEQRLAAAITGAIAEDTVSGKVVGSVLLLGDNASFYYIKDVIVHPDWQRKQIGTALMQQLNDWLEKNAPPDVVVALVCRETLEPFYQQFGFFQTFSMIKYI